MSNKLRSIRRAAESANETVLTEQASKMFLDLARIKSEVENQINTLLVGAGVDGQWEWKLRESDKRVIISTSPFQNGG